jgi:hypothetical protein
MPYTADWKRTGRPSEELRAKIPGWGVDLDPKDRPAFPKEVMGVPTGAHWDFPDRQPGHEDREKSPEHKWVTPVFGTSVPLKGLSGALRRYAYNFGEGRARHWLMLIAADRVDVMESRLQAMAIGKPDNPIAESGVMAEVHHHGLQSRRGQGRFDVRHQPVDYAMMLAPYVLLGYAAYKVSRHFSGRQEPGRMLARAYR